MRDRGSMVLLTVMVGVALTAATLLALIPVASGLIAHERAQNAADAAALAGVTGGQSASGAIAARNHAELVSWSQEGDEVTVTVRVGARQATARATDRP